MSVQRLSTDVHEARLRRHRRVRGKVRGTAERPRLAVFRSNRGIFAQLVDDDSGRRWSRRRGSTSASQRRQDRPGDARSARRWPPARRRPGIERVVFDRGGYLYHGRVKALADGAREGGLAALMAVDVAETRELKERVVEINRVAKVVKGGRRFSFTALVVIGDEVDRVGVGYGKAREVPLAISKAVDDAKKNMFTVPKHGQTITHESLGRFGAARVLLRPASPGTGVIAGGGVRAVLELGGIRDVLAKSLGTTNPINMLKAAEAALRQLRRPEDVAKARGKAISEVLSLQGSRAEPRRSRRGRRSLVTARGGEREMPKLKLTQVRSAIGQSQRHRGTLRALGLGRIGKTREQDVSPALEGMLRKVRHLVKVEES